MKDLFDIPTEDKEFERYHEMDLDNTAGIRKIMPPILLAVQQKILAWLMM